MIRTQEPLLGKPEKISIPEPEKILLANGIPLYCINTGEQEIIKLEIVFNAGEWYSDFPILMTAINDLMDEGTKAKSAFEIAEAFDFYGAYLQTECTHDIASIKLFTLTKFAKQTFELLLEILQDAIFPDKEIEIYKAQNIQKLKINKQKVDYLTRKEFGEALFGKTHPYGRRIEEENYVGLNRALLSKGYQSFYHHKNCFIILAGKISEQTKKITSEIFGSWKSGDNFSLQNKIYKSDTSSQQKIKVEKEGAVQSSIRIGKILFNRKHPDYIPITVLSTVLGGYFGSRLMTNIREDKGYTYGIGCGMVSLLNEGYFFISTQVGNDVCQAALKEIYIEIERLRNDLIPDDELKLVKSYLTGVFQRSIDGPMELSEKIKTLLISGLDITFYSQYLEKLNSVSADELHLLGQKYFDISSLKEVVAG